MEDLGFQEIRELVRCKRGCEFKNEESTSLVVVTLNTEFLIKMRNSIPFWKLKKCIAERINESVKNLCFIFDNDVIGDEDTPTTLQFCNNDVIFVCRKYGEDSVEWFYWNK